MVVRGVNKTRQITAPTDSQHLTVPLCDGFSLGSTCSHGWNHLQKGKLRNKFADSQQTRGKAEFAHLLSVSLQSAASFLHPRTLPPLSSSPSLVGTCWEHHYLTGLTPPTLPAMKLKRMFSLSHLGRSRLLGDRLGCGGGYVHMPPPARPKSSSFSSRLWSDVITKATVWTVHHWDTAILQRWTKQGQRSTMTSHVRATTKREKF